jgi:hypothetical protein
MHTFIFKKLIHEITLLHKEKLMQDLISHEGKKQLKPKKKLKRKRKEKVPQEVEQAAFTDPTQTESSATSATSGTVEMLSS